jgi:hypothetical protein
MSKCHKSYEERIHRQIQPLSQDCQNGATQHFSGDLSSSETAEQRTINERVTEFLLTANDATGYESTERQAWISKV